MVGAHRAVDDRVAAARGGVDDHLAARARDRVRREQHTGGGRLDHPLHHHRHADGCVVDALADPVGSAVRDGPLPRQGRPAPLHGLDHRIRTAHVQHGVVLSGEAGVRQVLRGGAGPHRHRAPAQPFVGGDDLLAQLVGQRAGLPHRVVRDGGDAEARGHPLPRRDQLRQPGRLPADHVAMLSGVRQRDDRGRAVTDRLGSGHRQGCCWCGRGEGRHPARRTGLGRGDPAQQPARQPGHGVCEGHQGADVPHRARDERPHERRGEGPAAPHVVADLPLVRPERGPWLPGGLGQRGRQHVRPDHGQRGAAAHRRAGCVGSVPDQRHPPPRPGVHPDLGDLVEVEVLRGVRGVQQPRNLPPGVGEHRSQQGLLLRDVPVVEPHRLPRAEQHHGPGLPRLPHRVDPDQPVDLRVHHHVPRQAAVIGQRERRQVPAEVVREQVLRAEHEPPHAGVEPVRADDQVEPSRAAAVELHQHAAGVLPEGGHGVAEPVLDLGLSGRQHDPGQLAAHDLDVAAVGHPRAECTEVHAHRPVSRPLHADPLGARARFLDPARQTHPIEHRDRGLEEVDGVPADAAPVFGCALDDGDPEPVAVQPPGDDRAGDTGAADENLGTSGERHGTRPFGRRSATRRPAFPAHLGRESSAAAGFHQVPAQLDDRRTVAAPASAW